MLKRQIKQKIDEILSKLVKDEFREIPSFAVEIPPKEFESDLACNIALLTGKILKKNPRELAKQFIDLLCSELKPGIVREIDIAGPGFINIRLSQKFLVGSFDSCIKNNFKFDYSEKKENVCIEFVSANPTGPLHVGHGRGAAIGDSLARIYEHGGARVVREYYVNNLGNQIDILGKSVEARIKELKGEQAELPQDGYKGGYIKDLAKQYIDGGRKDEIKKYSYEIVLSNIKNDLLKFGVEFDKWSFENLFHDNGLLEVALKQLEKKGIIYRNEGALWLSSSTMGDEKDRVVRRTDGRYTYLASDIAYHYDKLNRNFDRIINIWGADHHGYQKRLEAVMKSFGFNLEMLHIVFYQLVRLLRSKQIVPMSTRAGEFIALKEVIDEVGKDACRFFFLLRSPESHLDFDLELARKHTSENPVYYVQYAHARICSIFREALKKNIVFNNDVPNEKILSEKQEIDLIKQVVFFPDMLYSCIKDATPHYITTYLIECVKKFHAYYDNHRVISEDIQLTQARLYLINGVKKMIAMGLHLLGIDSPEKM
ncbi:MAG: arginine--tRNA ligase [bacterium]